MHVLDRSLLLSFFSPIYLRPGPLIVSAIENRLFLPLSWPSGYQLAFKNQHLKFSALTSMLLRFCFSPQANNMKSLVSVLASCTETSHLASGLSVAETPLIFPISKPEYLIGTA